MALEEQLGYFFFDKSILYRALTRKAYALEQRQKNQDCEDQEAYRSLGDALIKAVLTELMIRSGLTVRKEIVARLNELDREENLARISQELNLGNALKLGVGEKQQHANEQPSVLAESLEAVLGAIYFDGGYSAVRETIRRLFAAEFPSL